MSNLPLYKGHMQTKVLHKGLLFEKFYEWKELGGKLKEQDKKGFLEKFKGDCGDKAELELYAKRHLELIDSIGGECMTFSNQWHFVTGMGGDHPLENGFAWHHTLGVPYIAGSGVKGAFRAYLWEWTDEPKAKILKWCGYTKDEGAEYGLEGESGGSLIFFDAIPIEPTSLAPDVMTPHMGDWYETGNKEIHDDANTPADWHNPNPVLFLAVKKATFLFSIATRNKAAKEDTKKAMKFLGEALDYIGIGVKTAVGYGRFEKNDEFIKLNEEQKKAEELEKLSPMDRVFAKCCDEIPKLVDALEKNEFGDDTKIAALRIKEIMIQKNEWKPDGNENKDKSAKRTRKVEKFL